MSLQMNHKQVMNYARSRLYHLFDASSFFVEEKGLRNSCQLPHKGCYLSISDSSGSAVLREGFITKSSSNILDSLDKCIEAAFARLKAVNYTMPQIVVSSVVVTVIEECVYLPDPLMWDMNVDGVYFQWGDRYRGLYLPHEIRKLNVSKTAVLDRLVAWETKLAGNLWRLPEGLVFKLVCTSLSS